MGTDTHTENYHYRHFSSILDTKRKRSRKKLPTTTRNTTEHNTTHIITHRTQLMTHYFLCACICVHWFGLSPFFFIEKNGFVPCPQFLIRMRFRKKRSYVLSLKVDEIIAKKKLLLFKLASITKLLFCYKMIILFLFFTK